MDCCCTMLTVKISTVTPSPTLQWGELDSEIPLFWDFSKLRNEKASYVE